MILQDALYAELADAVKEKNSRIVIYGAGVIGQILMPYLIKKYNLTGYLDCFIDRDSRLKDKKVLIDDCSFPIHAPDYLHKLGQNTVLLITNSKFWPVLKDLDSVEELDEVQAYIVPVMQLRELESSGDIVIERRTEKPLIPKKIHYCWFSDNPMPKFLQDCVETWKLLCHDYEFICWNENNFDVNKYRYTKEAYEKKKYGFVSDVARLDILYEHGGIFMDTDVTLLKNLDDLLYQPAFIGVEKWGNINSGSCCGFCAGHPVLKEMLDDRKKYSFVWEDGSLNTVTNGLYETLPFLEAGFRPDDSLQTVKGVTVYPSYVFCPYDYMSCETVKKEATVSVHHFYGSWLDENDCRNRENTQKEYLEMLHGMRL